MQLDAVPFTMQRRSRCSAGSASPAPRSWHSGGVTFLSVSEALAQLDEQTRVDAQVAVDTLLDGDSFEGLQLAHVFSFVMHRLPTKFICDSAEHHEIAWALGDLLAAAGLDRHAALCRAQSTHEVIDLWATDPAKARRRFRALMDRSGFDPPDTPTLTWGGVQGLTEHLAWFEVSATLEEAIEEGRLRPGKAGWRAVAADIADARLTTTAHGDADVTLLRAIHDERLESFSKRPQHQGLDLSLLREQILATGADDLAAVSDTTEPARWILEQIDGVVLTQAGNLPRSLALATDARYDWFDLKPRFTVRNEHDLTELAEIHRFARSTRLVLRRGRRLGVTKTGRELLDHPTRFTTTLLRYMFDRSDIDGDASIVKATMMLAATPPSAEQLRDSVQDYLGRRWRSSDPNDTFRYTTSHLVRIGRAFGWVEHDQTSRLTALGRTAALTGLRLLLTGPVNSLV
jgi:hypothetical protein